MMIAQQVGGKATRDALFLSNYAVTSLPIMVLGAALVSVVFALLSTLILVRRGPGTTVPVGFLISAGLHLGEWGIAAGNPGIAAVLVYLHTAVMGAVLISWFWSLVTESFDPHTARRRMDRIAGGAALGGLLGGLLAERVGASFAVTTMLPVLSLMHVVCAGAVLPLRSRSRRLHARASSAREVADPRYGLRVFKQMPYLRHLAWLVALGTISAGLIDYVFKAEAVSEFESGETLMRFFAIFYTLVSLATFSLQATTSRLFLERAGLDRTVATLPSTILGGSIFAILIPGLPAVGILRGLESVLRSSLFRSGYELLYTPIPKEKKRATKTVIDVGFDRMGDAVGAVLTKLVLLLGAAAARSILLVLAAGFGIGAVLIIRRLQRGYVKALEESLLKRAVDLDLSEVKDSTTRLTVMQTMSRMDIDLSSLQEQPSPGPSVLRSWPADSSAAPPTADPILARIAAFRSGDPDRVRSVLVEEGTPDPALVPHLIRLLAWDAVREEVVRTLSRAGPRITGQLADALLDPDEEFAIRRRAPRVLATFRNDHAAWALFQGLQDKRFEVRFQCGRALARLRQAGVAVPARRRTVFETVLREVQVDRRVWESRRLLERLDDARESVFVDEVLRTRANRSLEHVFTVLSLVLPREPLQVAFRGLHTDDRMLRGTALEYLESILPDAVREALWPFVQEPKKRRVSERSREEILADLMRSNESIQINLRELETRRDRDEPSP
jgi:hypothetical protein